ncbi:IQ-domain 19 [Hirschfeldia incana]|nr:IQ-domain 19 [Hirschfeldia incana]
MGKTSKWIRNFLTGKKERSKEKIIHSECGFISPVQGIPKEKRRWSFRRSSATRPPPCASTLKESPPSAQPPPPQPFDVANVDTKNEENKNPTAAEIAMAVQEFAAVKIQARYRSHLARKALRALKGLVKLQALVRGHLVRKQATATLRCMQALITLQAKAREQSIRMIGDSTPKSTYPRTPIHKTRINNIYHEIENVEMETQPKFYSPAPSIANMTPRYSSHFEDCNAFNTAQRSPQCFRFKEYYNGDTLSSYGYPLFPNYMANTQSSKAKARSHSAPKQRPHEIYEKHMSPRRRSNVEAPRNGVLKSVRMQRPSSSQLGKESPHHQYYPWMASKLDRSNVSVMEESECGSTRTVMTNTKYGRHVDVQRNVQQL